MSQDFYLNNLIPPINRIFNFNNVILAFAILLLIFSVPQFLQSRDGFDKLILHKGIIESKGIIIREAEGDENPLEIFHFKVLNDSNNYTASIYPIALDNLLQEGDSIEFYTKIVDSEFGNFVTNGDGRVWNTHSPNEVYHLVCNKYSAPLVDFKQHEEVLGNSIFILPFFSLVLFGWWFLRRSGAGKPFIR